MSYKQKLEDRLDVFRNKLTKDPNAPTPLPCPFCGRDKGVVYGMSDDERGPMSWFRVCFNCHCVGPRKSSHDAAVESWNERYGESPTCPFCGSQQELFNADKHEPSGLVYCITCKICGCDGPPKKSEHAALKAWNKRIY